uniref:DNA polymerase II subunit 2 n=1 Tax=Rodentolepis nana TaxID=102285 RepID=A0A0R3TL36_RODNA
LIFQDIKKLLKLNGFILAPDASTYLTSTLGSNITSDVVKRFVESVLSSFSGLAGNRVTKSVCEKILSEWKSDKSSAENAIFLINALETPRFKYNRNMRKFVSIQINSTDDMHSLLPFSPLPKSFLFANRYEVVLQRVLRNPLFSDESRGFKLRSIEFLLSSGTKVRKSCDEADDDGEDSFSVAERPSVIILGFLIQLKNAQWYLEDVTNLVKLDFSHTRFHQGVFPEGSVVLTEGWYDEDAEVFRSTGIGLPPVERAIDTRRYFSALNPFGGGEQGINGPPASLDNRMSRLLDASPCWDRKADSMLVILGEVHLEALGNLEHLETIFTGYADFPPSAFLICGDFISPDYSPHVSERCALLKQLFKRLSDTFLRIYGDSEARGHCQPKLILIPGPHDPCIGPTGIYPRPPLPLDLFGITAPQQQCPDWLWLASNPCRIRLFTREIVVFRYDYAKHLLRHCIHLPSPAIPTAAPESTTIDPNIETQLPEEFENLEIHQERDELNTTKGDETSSSILGMGLARCLASQGHLTPLPLHISPIYWPFDQALALNPLPDLVVAVEPDSIADLNATLNSPSSDLNDDPLGGCQFVNPGRFGNLEYNFKVYYPGNRLVEDSKLPT